MRAAIEHSSGQDLTVVTSTTKSVEQPAPRGGALTAPESNVIAIRGTEPFIDASRAAEFVNLHRKTLLRLAREGSIPAHPLAGNKRRMWRFLVSELDAWARSKVNSNCDRCQNSRSK